MKRVSSVFLLLFLAIGFVYLSCSTDQGPLAPGTEQLGKMGRGGDYTPDRILVKFKEGADVAAINARLGAVQMDEIREIGVKILRVRTGRVQAMVAAYNRHPKVEFAEPDYIMYADGIPNAKKGFMWDNAGNLVGTPIIPNDALFKNQWGLNNTGQTGGTPDADIDAPEAWADGTGDPNVLIAILDTGIDQSHEDLAAKIVANKDFTSSPNGWEDMYGHGTHCAGIAAAITDNGVGVAGVGYNCGLINGKVLGDNGSGSSIGIAKGILWAAKDQGAQVISMSLGSSSPSRSINLAITLAWRRYGAVIVAAAGNDGVPSRHYPAAFSLCIAVAATDHNDAKAGFSNYGASWVDVAAPGVNTYSSLPDHPCALDGYKDPLHPKYGWLSGTSMATPHVAGLAGLVWATGNYPTNADVRAQIENTCDAISGTGTYWAYGRINADNAIP